jgi:aspartate racemase
MLNKDDKPLPYLLAGIQGLKIAGCTTIVIPCNTAHFWFSHLEKIAAWNAKIIHIVDSVTAALRDINVTNDKIVSPSCNNLYTEESRAIMPAWTARDLEQVDWYYPPLNPQENTCMPFTNNLNTRILEKDYFTPKRDCLLNDANNGFQVNSIIR